MTDNIIAIYGSGGHAKIVHEILTLNKHHVSFFLDDNPKEKTLNRLPIFKPNQAPDFSKIIFAIGDNKARQSLFNKYKNNTKVISVIHPNSIISPTAKIGIGTVICAGSVINADSTIGDNCIVNTSSSIDHDCIIMDHSHIAPGCHLAGNVTVETGGFLGIGTNVIPGKKVGAWAICGAGAVVISNIPSRQTAVGVPARIIK